MKIDTFPYNFSHNRDIPLEQKVTDLMRIWKKNRIKARSIAVYYDIIPLYWFFVRNRFTLMDSSADDVILAYMNFMLSGSVS